MTDQPSTPPDPASAPGPGWWQASDGNWYPPDQQPGYAAPGYTTPGYTTPGYAAPGYGSPYYGQPAGYGYTAAVARSTNGLAIASLILGCAQFIAWILTGIPAIVCGHIALSQIRRTGQEGRGMAIAGLVLGYVGLALFIAFVALVVVATEELDGGDVRFENVGALP